MKTLISLAICQFLLILAPGIVNPTAAQNPALDVIKDIIAPETGVDTLNGALNEAESIKILKGYQSQLDRINKALIRRPDTASVAIVLQKAEGLVKGINQLLAQKEIMFSLRMIGTMSNFISISERSLEKHENVVEGRIKMLAELKPAIDTIHKVINSPGVMKMSTARSDDYKVFIKNLRQKEQSTDSLLSAQWNEFVNFESRIQNIRSDLTEISQQINFESRRITDNLFTKEVPYIWQPFEAHKKGEYNRVFSESLLFNWTILARFLSANPLTGIFLVVLFVLLAVWFERTLRIIQTDKKYTEVIMSRTHYIPRYPVLSAGLVVLTLLVLFFPDPPMILFSFGLLLVACLTTVLLWGRIQKHVYIIWCIFFVLFVASLISNLYWEVLFEERNVLMVMGLMGITLGLLALYKYKSSIREMPKYIPYLIWVYLSLELCALLSNVFGRLSLSKMLSITATVSMMQAVSLVIFVLIIKEFAYLLIELGSKRESNPISTDDFEKIRKKAVNIFSVIALLLWAYYFLNNLSVYSIVVEEISIFLQKPRSLHYATFSFGTILTFVLTLYIATFLANNIAYFTEIRDRKYTGLRDKRIGSQALLIRLGIISLGFFIAVAATGIPLDRITIVLGALSVGIGFGLQTIINNVVSGIILAFERPIQIGDTIDSGPDQGVVKEIGIRSSKIRNWDGAEVIIPNGDLLANRLTNWTLHDKHRRIELIIGVSYQSDIEQVTELIRKSLAAEGVLKFPLPSVYLQKLNDNSIDFRVLFWVADVDLWLILRDKMMRAIYKTLKENGVQIPFPQRDLHIKSMPEGTSLQGKTDAKAEPPKTHQNNREAEDKNESEQKV